MIDNVRLTAAIAAFEKVERTGKACLEHPKVCWICRSHFLSAILPCPWWKRLMAEFTKAKVDANPWHMEFSNLQLELDIAKRPDAAPTTEWLENLFKLD